MTRSPDERSEIRGRRFRVEGCPGCRLRSNRATGLTIEVRDAADFAARMPEQALALVSVTAAVNERYVERGKPPALTLILV